MSPRTLRLGRWTTLLLAVFAVALLAGGAIAAVAPGANGTADDGPTASLSAVDAQDGEEPLVERCAAEIPDDYEDPAGGTADTIGWVDGYWYDEPVGVNATDGLTDEELRDVTARTAARVEAMRCLTFEDGLPPISVLDNEEFADLTGDQYNDVNETNRRLLDAQLSTLLMVPDESDPYEVAEETTANATLGQYYAESDQIVLVRPEGSTAPIRESTLFQELGHALQDQQFDLSTSGERTSDESQAWTGLVEGDINWLEAKYVDRCEAGRWSESCIEPEPTESGGESSGESDESGSTDPPSWGYSLARQQPYYEGPAYVKQVYEAGGWDAVNALYEDVPETTLEVTAPERAEDAAFVDPDIDAEPSEGWARLTPANGTGHDEAGVGWIASMFMAPSWESGFQQNVVSTSRILHTNEAGEIREIGGITYDPAAAMGWRGDRMVAYERGDDTATVWKSAWADESEAAEFADAYETLLEIRGASATEEYANAFAFAAESDYDGAVAIHAEDDRVTIVSAPSVDATTEVAPTIELAADDGTDPGEGSGTGTESAGNESATDGGNGSDDIASDDDGTGDGSPGFGVAAGLIAALLGTALLARRER